MKPLDALMSDWLGRKAPMTMKETLQAVEDGFALSTIEHLMQRGLGRSEIGSVILPWRTFERRRSQHKKLTTDESQRLIRMVRVLARAETVFGNREKALSWLREPKRRFDNRTPIALLRTESGARMVDEMLI